MFNKSVNLMDQVFLGLQVFDQLAMIFLVLSEILYTMILWFEVNKETQGYRQTNTAHAVSPWLPYCHRPLHPAPLFPPNVTL